MGRKVLKNIEEMGKRFIKQMKIQISKKILDLQAFQWSLSKIIKRNDVTKLN